MIQLEIVTGSKVVKDEPTYQVVEIKSETQFGGCQCFKDCNCSEDFVPEELEYYKVIKKITKGKKHVRRRTTTHQSWEGVENRIKQITQ